MPDPYFFGYGSLVNRATHDYGDARPARLSGWRRLWRHTSLRDVAYLSVVQVQGGVIDGLIAKVPNADWAALDLRENAYDRLPVAPQQIRHDHPALISIEVYMTKPGKDAAPSIRHPILQSYLDTVVSGYHQVFGVAGAHAFFASTDGWDSPILNDRAAPIYPRTTAIDVEVRRLIDTALDDRQVVRRAPP